MFKPGLLKGKRILITGGGTGLGKEIAKRYAELGAELWLAGRRGGVLQETASELTRTFEHKDFVAALSFVNRVGGLAEKAGHHPDIDIRYNKVRLGLVTHDAGGLTSKDFDLAAAVDNLR